LKRLLSQGMNMALPEALDLERRIAAAVNEYAWSANSDREPSQEWKAGTQEQTK
jgi:hypothetical protein